MRTMMRMKTKGRRRRRRRGKKKKMVRFNKLCTKFPLELFYHFCSQLEYGAFPQELCIICLSKLRTGSIIHDQTGHQVCCFPMCNKTEGSKEKETPLLMVTKASNSPTTENTVSFCCSGYTSYVFMHYGMTVSTGK